MNEDSTHISRVVAQVTGYADGIYNLELTDPDLEQSEKLEVSREEAERVCDLLDAELPDPDPSPPEEWG